MPAPQPLRATTFIAAGLAADPTPKLIQPSSLCFITPTQRWAAATPTTFPLRSILPAKKAPTPTKSRRSFLSGERNEYQGGAVAEETVSHAIYLLPNGSCSISACWGNPEGFLRDFGKSEMIHITDRYVGTTANHRYTVGTRAKISFTPSSTPFTDADMQAVVHAVASALGKTGYGHLYHVFLLPGTDECFDNTFTVCARKACLNFYARQHFEGAGSAGPFSFLHSSLAFRLQSRLTSGS